MSTRLWRLTLFFLACLLLAPALLIAWLPVQLYQPGWQEGPVLGGLDWMDGDCLRAHAEGLHVTRGWPVQVEVELLTLHDCPHPATTKDWRLDRLLALASHASPFTLNIRQVVHPGVLPFALKAESRDRLLNLRLERPAGHLNAHLDPAEGRWWMDGRLPLEEIMEREDWVALEGAGRIRTESLDGELHLALDEGQTEGGPSPATGLLGFAMTARGWQAQGVLDQPWPLREGWHIEPGRLIQAEGSSGKGTRLRLNLTTTGPQGQLRLELQSDDDTPFVGRGRIRLEGPDMAGDVGLQWTRTSARFEPADVRLPGDTQLGWSSPLVVPLAEHEEGPVAFWIKRSGLRLEAREGRLAREGSRWQWRGKLGLDGQHLGYEIRGDWDGVVHLDDGQLGLAGAPMSLDVHHHSLDLQLKLPVESLRAPDWPGEISFTGLWQKQPLQGHLAFRHAPGQWNGELEARSRKGLLEQGSILSLDLPWSLAGDTLTFSTKGRVTLGQGLHGRLLVRPVTLRPTTPIRLDASGLHGRASLDSGGAVAARWIIPRTSGVLALNGRHANLEWRVPAWDTRGKISARFDGDAPRGTLTLNSELSEGMTRGLDFMAQSGSLNAQARWEYRRELRFDGEFHVQDAHLDLGGIQAEGITLDGQIEQTAGKLVLHSTQPLAIRRMDVGTEISDIRARWDYREGRWQLLDLHAHALGGTLSGPRLSWPSDEFEPLTATALDLSLIAQLHEKPIMQMEGRIDGRVPVRINDLGIAVHEARLYNRGPLVLRLVDSPGIERLAGEHASVEWALAALSHVHAKNFEARVNMAPDGLLQAAMMLEGHNPDQGDRPVVLNYTHEENLYDLMRSLRMSQELSERVLRLKIP